jgi:quercetin dioxygenase-like cupin family protein
VIIGHRGCDPKLFRPAWWVWQWNFRFISEVTLQSPARSHGQRNVWPTRNQIKRKEKMNSITQCKKIRILPLLLAPALVALGALTAAPARATPACGLASQTLAVGHFPNGLLNLMCNEFDQYGWFLKTMVKGDSDVYVVRNTWPVGAHSGWHTHPGPSLITVISGELTVYEADSCATPVVYHAGESFTDIGCGDVHLVRNEGTVCAVNMVVQIIPAGLPRRFEADQPANCATFTCPSPTPCPK